MWILEAVTLTAVLASGLEQVPDPRIWLDRGVEPVLEPGDRVRIYYRTDADAYVAILQIDTDGTARMLYPRSSTENHYVRADRDYRLLFPRSAYWNVDDRPGVGYFFIVTSPTPFDFSDFRYSYYDRGWDLSAVGSTVYSDPYVAMDDYVARLVPDWENVDYGLDFISYGVGGAFEFPRFLCYQCHGFRPYSTWNPYRYTCLNFRVVVYDDPYFYPAYRYRPDRVVMVGPRNPTLPRFGFKERAAGDPGGTLTVVRSAQRDDPPPVADRSRVDQRAGRGRVASPSVAPSPTPTRRPDLPGRDEAPRRPTLERRSPAPSPGTRLPSDAPRPRPTQTSQRPRPSTRPPPEPRPSTRPPPEPRPSTRPPLPSGSSSARPVPPPSALRPAE